MKKLIFKKLALAFALALCANVSVFSQDRTWVSMGFEYAVFFENYKREGRTTDIETISLGFNMNVYRFYAENAGIFLHSLLAFPKSGRIAGGEEGIINTKFERHNRHFQLGFIVGPGFRSAWAENVEAKLGFGFSFLYTVAAYKEYMPALGRDSDFEIYLWSFGVGGDVGVKIDLSDAFFVSVGSIFAIDLARHNTVEIDRGRSAFREARGWEDKYSMVAVRPYITLGINLYWAGTGTNAMMKAGKPL